MQKPVVKLPDEDESIFFEEEKKEVPIDSKQNTFTSAFNNLKDSANALLTTIIDDELKK